MVLALGTDFDAANGTRVVDDPMCMGRLIETYLKATEALSHAPSFAVNMPFFAANAQGPCHFTRRLTASEIAALAAREPVAAAEREGISGSLVSSDSTRERRW